MRLKIQTTREKVLVTIAAGLMLGIMLTSLETKADMSCDQFTVQPTAVQESFLGTEIINQVRAGSAFSRCIRRNASDAREIVVSSCAGVADFSDAVELATRRLRSTCVAEGSFDDEEDDWESVESPFTEFRRP